MIARCLMHLVLGFSMASGAMADGGENTPRLAVTGIGRAMVPADQFQVTLGVRSSSQELQKAQQDVTKSMTTVLAALRALGLEAPADFQTSRYDISPQLPPRNNSRNQATNQKPREIIGYEVSANILVRTMHMDKAAKIIESAVSAGANDVGQIAFTSSDPRSGRGDAIKKAAKNAMEDASTLASATQSRLVRILDLSIDNAGPQPKSMNAMRLGGSGAESIEMNPGDVTVTARVTIVYEIDSASTQTSARQRPETGRNAS